MEITGDNLRNFAIAHGLRIMDHRNPDKWAEQINRNGGLCPCGKECPCSNCTCKFYEEDSDYVEITNPEIARAVQTLEDVKQKLIDMPQDMDEKTTEAIQETQDMVKTDAESHQCARCAEYMEGLARKLVFIKEECKKDPVSCIIERDLTIKRIEGMQETFIGVDTAMSEKDMAEIEKEPESKPEEPKKPNTPLELNGIKLPITSDYHSCVSDTMKGEFKETDDRNVKLCMSTKMCGQRHLTQEEALSECVK